MTTSSPNTRPLPASTTPTVLLIVDVQIGLNVHDTTYYGLTRSNPAFEANMTTLLAACRNYNANLPSSSPPRHPITILHINHHSTDPLSPLHPSKPTSSPQPCALPLPTEPLLHKSANSAFVGTDLASLLASHSCRQLLVAGIATDHCVSTTVRMAADLEVCGGRREGVWLVEDATACFDNGGSFGVEVVQGVSVESLRGEFCEVTGVKGVVEGCLR
ncbi:uncharacterized protein HMPREF1541_00806 [Cyphellophora europaea CBS 101466]|uniref:Isochorismatase-like domain-containing protein n=1 Tax=Cyphellophora europaea (strain CBS 101466) TaxID=1220924 RepID=W2SDB4_CYPE1|nr:uncharacterized protein HMPREF1541_00806 [Cyphellophora europaea CBS 101466]ETN46620.1 hypothetical protein HMPREF1541_00806 [Cyphellophora europaea CBS 101466]